MCFGSLVLFIYVQPHFFQDFQVEKVFEKQILWTPSLIRAGTTSGQPCTSLISFLNVFEFKLETIFFIHGFWY